jgi:hypothetical protein
MIQYEWVSSKSCRLQPNFKSFLTILINAEIKMDELKWQVLTETNGRMEADILKSYLEAEGIQVELVQEAVGHHIYPVTIDGLGRVQLFVSKEQFPEAKEILAEYNESLKSE